jgi:DNA-binding NtrC family response regulator
MVIPKSKRLLFLDDDEKRWHQLVDIMPDNIGTYCWVASAAQAINALKDTHFDVVLLDHDLGAEECGCVVVDWIIAHRKAFTNTRFIIHSWNPAGAEAMHLALYHAGLSSKRKMFHVEHISF